MNLQEQIGALEAGVDQLLTAAAARAACHAEAAPADQPAAVHTAPPGVAPANAVEPQPRVETRAAVTAPEHVVAEALAAFDAPADAAASVAPAIPADTPQAVAAAADDAGHATATQGDADEPAAESATPSGPIMQVARPSRNEITMTIGDQTVSLHPLQVGQLIEELANARASMQPEPPPGVPPGWRFVSTRNPVMAVQKQSNGDRVLVLRHTGHGWVPFTFSPEMVVQMYAMLTQR